MRESRRVMLNKELGPKFRAVVEELRLEEHQPKIEGRGKQLEKAYGDAKEVIQPRLEAMADLGWYRNWTGRSTVRLQELEDKIAGLDLPLIRALRAIKKLERGSNPRPSNII